MMESREYWDSTYNRKEMMMENRFRRVGHVERRYANSVVRRVDQIEMSQTTRGVRVGQCSLALY